MDRVLGLVLLFVLIFGIVVFFLIKKTKRPVFWYIPTIVLWLISITFFIMSQYFAEPMQDLGYLIMAMITGIATFLTLLVTLILSKFLKK